MKTFLLALCLNLVALTASAQAIPSVSIDDVVKIMDTSTVPVIVNFWASWCGPCIHEIPYFEKHVAAQKHKIKLVLVSLDFKTDYPTKLRSFVRKQGYRSDIVWLNETDADVFCPKIDSLWSGTIPVTLMVNKAKNYRAFFPYQLTEPRFKLELRKLIED